ncbi:LysR family transcriptional regulator [uncultured Acidaminococcus sp.]
MDIRELRYFVHIVQAQNFSKAAMHLYISQPALSKMLKKTRR